MQRLKNLFTHNGIGYSKILNFMKMSTLANLKFDNSVLKQLPIDKETSNVSRSVPGACFSLVDPMPVDNPELVVHSQNALDLLGISDNDVNATNFVEYFSGNELLPGSRTAAHCYCGHQFGHFSGQLGDGAAIYLGEIINSKGERWELQLKGAGKTPYSRHADGRKVLRSSIREFLCSEAMHNLGIPTTRGKTFTSLGMKAGTCVTSDSRVVRDILYDGHPIMERCTIVFRIAPSFIRFGSFEIFKEDDPVTGRKGPSAGRIDILHTMLQYVITTFFPQISLKLSDDKEGCYLEFYKEVIRRTAKLVALWQCVGFCHGVLNTDNMSILGLTIDYGPYGFMDYFDPDYICNASDNQGRYTYVKQPEICKWNLWKLAEALKDALPLDQSKAALNELYDKEFSMHYYETMRKKLGVTLHKDSNDETIIQQLLWTMSQTSADFTNTYRLLSNIDITLEDDSEIVTRLLTICQDVEGLKKKFKSTVNTSQVKALLQLSETQPGLVEQLGVSVEQLKSMLEKSEREKDISKLSQDEKSKQNEKLWSDWIKLYRERIELEMKESTDIKNFLKERKKSMLSINPRIILRNYMAQEVIEAADEGDFSKVQDLLSLLENPYEEELTDTVSSIERKADDVPDLVTKYQCSAPTWAADLQVT